MLRELLQRLCVECWGYPERPAFKEAAIRAEYVAMGIEVQEIPTKSGRQRQPLGLPPFREGRFHPSQKYGPVQPFAQQSPLSC